MTAEPVPKVFVHGNPECDAIWGPLADALTADGVERMLRLSPPGFGAPVPDGFDATPAAYVDWLVDELEAIGTPVDLVGHDWGAGHVFGTVAARPELVRSWAADCAGLIHPGHVWHDMAQAWRTPEVGEAVVEAMTAGTVPERAEQFVGLGMPGPVARAVAAAVDPTMGRCILTLYRAAPASYLAALGDRLAAADRPPGCVLVATADDYVPAELGLATAERLGADVVTLEGQGHWWMLSAPDVAAGALTAFWAGIGT